ncbi:MAG: outer membrane beta-barrel protein [Holosporales bacterium]|jgi:opacity protein-like surface antigen|nr:outer membrane beta-barrel protein [Holosporales bacterium]
MKKITIACIITSLLAFNASAAENAISPYISARVGIGTGDSYAYMPKSLGYGFMGAVGAQYNNLEGINLRLELEYSNFKFKDSDSYNDPPFDKYEASYNLDHALYLTNFYLEVFKDYKIKLYASIALGLASFKEDLSDSTYFYGTDVTILSNKKRVGSSFAGGLATGISFNITNNLASDVGGRCIEFGGNNKIRTCNATFGIRYNF